MNTERNELQGDRQVVEFAKKECTVECGTISIDFDADLKVYRISFRKKDHLGGNQDVYLDQEGVTQLIVYGE